MNKIKARLLARKIARRELNDRLGRVDAELGSLLDLMDR